MNDLSWIVYAADVVADFSVILTFAMVFSFAVSVAMLVYGGWIKDGYHRKFGDEIWKKGNEIQKLAIKSAAITLIFCGTLLIAVPSKTTIYLIAASEAGHSVVSTPDAQELLDGISRILKKRIADELGGD